MRKLVFLTLVCLLPYAVIQANWQRSITNYTRQDYKAANQNWMIDQHENGWMYFANNDGLLEYDGSMWNIYPIHNAKARSVKAGNDGRIYIGGLGQFGYFTPNNLGRLEYVCLSDSLDSSDKDACNTWRIHLIDDRVYFQTDHSVYYLENDKVYPIRFNSGITYSTTIDNRLYIGSGNNIYYLNGNQLTLIPKTKEYIKSKVVGMFRYEDHTIVITALNGIFKYNGVDFTKLESPADEFLSKNQVSCCALNDSILALGSARNGVVLLNLSKNDIENISIDNGLQNKTVMSLQFDRENNLWLGLENGIDCINLNSPSYYLYSNKTAIGSGYSSALYNGKLYLGTNQGLYETNYPININETLDLKLIPGTEGIVFSLLVHDNRLFCSGNNSLVVIDKEKISKISDINGVWSVQPLKQYPDYLVAGTYFGLCILKKTYSGWAVSNWVQDVPYSAKSMYIEEITNNIWLANKERGLFRVKLSDDLKSAEVKNYNSADMPTGHNIQIDKINGEIVMATTQGLFKYNQAKDILERYTELENTLDGNVPYTHIFQDNNKNIWYATRHMLKLVRFQNKENIWKKNEGEFYLKGILRKDYEHVRVIDDNHALIATEEGFCLIEFNKNVAKKYPLNLQIRRMYLTIGKDSLIYGSSYTNTNTAITIPYKHNSIRIEYSVNNYNKSLGTLFSYRLEGSDYNEWSEFSENNTKEYTNLKEGNYIFHVKLITDNDKMPIETSLAFEVLPPWHRSWYAYLSYVIAIILFTSYIYYKFIIGQQKTIRKKEMEIIKQKEENTKKDEKIVSLKEKNLQSELKHKSDELVRTTLNIVRKNEMLQKIKKEAISISRSIDEESLPNIRRKVIRLINSVDTNMEHDDDLQAFQVSFDSVHQDFFEKLDKYSTGLNKKEKMLCAYIRMDLMSKEIAPLMNISLRGVEISRYRLRKKLQLSSEDNLAEFLQQL